MIRRNKPKCSYGVKWSGFTIAYNLYGLFSLVFFHKIFELPQYTYIIISVHGKIILHINPILEQLWEIKHGSLNGQSGKIFF